MSQPEIFPHAVFIQRCFDLAINGAGSAAPNPLVGAVVVHEGKIIGEGYHKEYGTPHAEVNAINSVSEKNKSLLPHSTIYINLEPCKHFGKTPPCADLIVQSGIKMVVFSNHDPNPVGGGGAEVLRAAGVEVTTGILEEQGAWLNRRFFTFIKKKRPYIILKWAQSADGFFTRNIGEQHWITGEQSKRLVHRWRSEEAAILVGTNTIAVDNPQLTNRLWMQGKQPLRVVLDKTLRLPASLHVFNSDAPTLVFTERKKENSAHVSYAQIPFDANLLKYVIQKLHALNIQSVIVEGGAQMLSGFINENLWDEARIFTGKAFFGSGMHAPGIEGKAIAEEKVGDDNLKIVVP